MDVSVCLHTCSPDSFLEKHGIQSAIAMVADCLERQDFDSFELCFADAHYEDNRELVASLGVRFPIRHTPILHRYWTDKGHIDIASSKNTAALMASGELVISIDDAEVFNDNFISSYWNYYKEHGLLAHAYHRRCNSIQVSDGLPVYPFVSEEYINDSRKFEGEVERHTHGDWLYAGSSCRLQNLFDLNGHNELADGQKALEDVNWGCSLEKIGERFVLDKSLHVRILDHDAVYQRSHFTAIDNFALITCVREIDGFEVGNRDGMITPKALELIRSQTIRFRKFDPISPDRIAAFEVWKKTPTFNFKQEWEKIHDHK